MGKSLQKLVYDKYFYDRVPDPSLPTGFVKDNPENWISPLQARGWINPQTDDVFSDATANRVFGQILPELSWQDLLKYSFQETGGQMGTPDIPVYDNLVKRLDATGWGDAQKKNAILNAANTHYTQHGSSYTGWSPEEGIAGLLGLPDYSAAAHQQAQQQYSDAHTAYSEQANNESLMNALKLGSVFAAPFAAAAFSPAAGAGAGIAEEIAALTGSMGAGATGFTPAGAGALGALDVPWGVNQQQGAGAMELSTPDWLNTLLSETGELGIPAAQLEGGFNAALSNAPWWSSLPTGLQDIAQIASKVPGGIQNLVNGGSSNDQSWAGILGKLAAAGLGAYGANQQANSLSDLATKYSEYGAPSRARFEASMTPGFDVASIPGYSSAVDNAMKTQLAKLSATGGNPFGNPGGLIDANKAVIAGTSIPALSEYQRLNLSAGGLGNLNAAIPSLQTSAIQSEGNILNALGYGLNAIANPQPSLSDLARRFAGYDLQYGL